MQFWEDVDEGLDGIESFYAKQGQDIDRIRTFSKRARGDLPKPEGCGPGHKPSEEHIDGLTAKPFWDLSENPELFPWAAELEAKSDIIQGELEDYLLNPAQLFKADSAVSATMGDGWSAVRLQRLGKYTENVKIFPGTYQIIKKLGIPLAVRGLCFARQAGGSGVAEHSDGRNFILTAHLGLKVPEGCWIKVGEEKRSWELGKLTTLDTSFVHSTGNSSNEDRHVLIIDFWHPEITPAERAALEFVYDLRNKYESGVIPLRKPKALQRQEQEGGLASIFNVFTNGNGNK
ncbi:unnamed protein product [Cylindrotheca closterium]|uniref:Aspartyl/asparaginy/proline hydroxylase domain-containing protein n=1 Tax=Cylindrotheca closterium TaxID=2856 RepID=A0AAD2G0W7_9STRA|nr:unnamed protein product [Cylindrotheca closterium]